jgi:hypothetical protein
MIKLCVRCLQERAWKLEEDQGQVFLNIDSDSCAPQGIYEHTLVNWC